MFWIISNLLLALQEVFMIYRLQKEKGVKARREILFAQADMVKNVLDCFYAYSFFDVTFMTDKNAGLLGMFTSVIALSSGLK